MKYAPEASIIDNDGKAHRCPMALALSIQALREERDEARAEAERCGLSAKVMSDCASDWKDRVLKAEAELTATKAALAEAKTEAYKINEAWSLRYAALKRETEYQVTQLSAKQQECVELRQKLNPEIK